jgi:hypothetical protein
MSSYTLTVPHVAVHYLAVHVSREYRGEDEVIASFTSDLARSVQRAAISS